MPTKGAPLNKITGRAVAAALATCLAQATALQAAAADAAGELDAVRRQCIAAAHDLQQHEQRVQALGHNIDLLGQDAAGRKRGLDEGRGEEAQLLGAIERVALHPPQPVIAAAGTAGTAVDRLRGELLLRAVDPALHRQAHALGGEIERVAALRQEIAGKEAELGPARQALAKERAQLAALVGQREKLGKRLLPRDTDEAGSAWLARDAKDLADLIKRASTAADRRDKNLADSRDSKAKAAAKRSDPTRPSALRDFAPAESRLTPPAAAPVGRGFSAGTASGEPSQGLRFDPPPGAVVVAPFDGQVIFAGPFGAFGVVLIIRHGGLYHSLLAGLARSDVKAEDWVLAGEPLGAMPDQAGRALYFELRRNGQPVDPQPLLAASDDGPPLEPERQNGDQRVRE